MSQDAPRLRYLLSDFPEVHALVEAAREVLRVEGVGVKCRDGCAGHEWAGPIPAPAIEEE